MPVISARQLIRATAPAKAMTVPVTAGPLSSATAWSAMCRPAIRLAKPTATPATATATVTPRRLEMPGARASRCAARRWPAANRKVRTARRVPERI